MCVTAKQQLKCCSCGENHTANYRGCNKWKEAKAAVPKQAQGDLGQKYGFSSRLNVSKAGPLRLSPELERLGSGWNLVQKERVIKTQEAIPTPNTTSSDLGNRTEQRATGRGGLS
jgi:hypothetical protein